MQFHVNAEPGEPRQLAGEDLPKKGREAIVALDYWTRQRAWIGFDPYDCRDTVLCRLADRLPWLLGYPLRRVVEPVTFRYAPASLRVLRARPKWNAKAAGLFVSSYARLSAIDDGLPWMQYALQCAESLLGAAEPGYHGPCWGYPFDWRSVKFIPKGTPSVVVTTTCGNGFWDLFQRTSDEQYLDQCRGICEFICRDLNRRRFAADRICFSYTPIDDYLVHNANLMAAEFLVRIGNAVGNAHWQELGRQAAEYALSEQNDDGSLFYWGKDWPRNKNHRDIYHSGFEIRSLWNLWKLTDASRFQQATDRYLDFFVKSYLREDGMPMRLPGDFDHPTVNIHGCAEAILCLATILKDYPDVLGDMQRVTEWSLEHMQNSDGSWAYEVNRRGRIDRMAYMRWGQAWMFRALVEYLQSSKETL